MKSTIKDIQKIESIVHTDYSNYPNPLREVLNGRKKLYKLLHKGGYEISNEEHLYNTILYYDLLIKDLLYL